MKDDHEGGASAATPRPDGDPKHDESFAGFERRFRDHEPKIWFAVVVAFLLSFGFTLLAQFLSAERVFRGGDLSVGRMAAECGYADQAHLSREFTDLTGCTPTALLAGDVPFVQDGTDLVGPHSRHEHPR